MAGEAESNDAADSRMSSDEAGRAATSRALTGMCGPNAKRIAEKNDGQDDGCESGESVIAPPNKSAQHQNYSKCRQQDQQSDTSADYMHGASDYSNQDNAGRDPCAITQHSREQ